MSKIYYVNCILISDDFKTICLIHKQRGPKFLIGKFNFIGGKLEEGENFEDALTREVQEETGLDISHYDRYLINKPYGNNEFQLDNFAVIVPSDVLHSAKTVESEPIIVTSLSETLHNAKNNPEMYAPNFHYLLETAIAYCLKVSKRF